MTTWRVSFSEAIKYPSVEIDAKTKEEAIQIYQEKLKKGLLLGEYNREFTHRVLSIWRQNR